MFSKKDKSPAKGPAAAPVAISVKSPLPAGKPGSAGKQAYEARRAQKAGMGLDKWLAEKDKRAQAERDVAQQARRKAEPGKPGLLRRLLDRAHRPI